MADLRCKGSARFVRFTPAMMRMLNVLYTQAKHVTDVDSIVITSANDSLHMKDSRHYKDEALDLRTHHFSSSQAVELFANELRIAFSSAFTVLHEDKGGPNDHLHIQPKIGTVYAD